MPEKVVELLNAIEKVRGKEYTEGLVDMANILTPTARPDEAEAQKAEG